MRGIVSAGPQLRCQGAVRRMRPQVNRRHPAMQWVIDGGGVGRAGLRLQRPSTSEICLRLFLRHCLQSRPLRKLTERPGQRLAPISPLALRRYRERERCLIRLAVSQGDKGRGSNPSNIAKTCTTSNGDDQKVALLDSLSGTAFSFNQAKALEILLCRQTDPLLAQAGEPCGSAFNYVANKLAKHGHPEIRRKAGLRCNTDKGPG